MTDKKQREIENNVEFQRIVKEIVSNDSVQEMKKYRQHGNMNCFEHCYRVAYESYRICKKWKLDYVSVARAGMVHDMFLYDWRKKSPEHKPFHAFHHGKKAFMNASKEFALSKKGKDMIIKHMWPLTIIPPWSIEGIILSCVDKYCAITDMIDSYRK